MAKQSLGTIEVIGLTAALEAADAACKAADVTLLGYEATDGMGMVAVKVLGQVGAVTAAVNAAKFAAGKINRVVSVSIIPRPNPQIEPIVKTAATVGLGAPAGVDPDAPGSKPALIGRPRPRPSAPAQAVPPQPAVEAPEPAEAPPAPAKAPPAPARAAAEPASAPSKAPARAMESPEPPAPAQAAAPSEAPPPAPAQAAEPAPVQEPSPAAPAKPARPATGAAKPAKAPRLKPPEPKPGPEPK
ncbi:MAG: BMC domain-containing protein [Propionibacteriaceae bacterium]|jgi:hypothetical protein|nr:BMC domain-containing protein [Propionibacteriaceae bacterium]